jgi:hypothetical protein
MHAYSQPPFHSNIVHHTELVNPYHPSKVATVDRGRRYMTRMLQAAAFVVR